MDITNPIYHDADKAREHLEALRWPDGAYCPHCGSFNVLRMKGKTQAGMFLCRDCRDKFSVRVGSIFHRSHIPLNKWLLGFHMMASSKKGVSAHQLHRMLGITYKSAWFMAHRIREAMTNPNAGPIGGTNKVVEADETYMGGKAKNRAFAPPPKKHAVMTLIERDGEARSFHVANVRADTLRETLVTTASRKSYLITDENKAYVRVGKEYSGHAAVNHSKDEYSRLGGFVHTNTAENFFSILKRGVYGVYHHVSEAHLPRYLAEFDMRYNTRKVSDAERLEVMLKGAEGKRLTYHQPRQAAHA